MGGGLPHPDPTVVATRRQCRWHVCVAIQVASDSLLAKAQKERWGAGGGRALCWGGGRGRVGPGRLVQRGHAQRRSAEQRGGGAGRVRTRTDVDRAVKVPP